MNSCPTSECPTRELRRSEVEETDARHQPAADLLVRTATAATGDVDRSHLVTVSHGQAVESLASYLV